MWRVVQASQRLLSFQEDTDSKSQPLDLVSHKLQSVVSSIKAGDLDRAKSGGCFQPTRATTPVQALQVRPKLLMCELANACKRLRNESSMKATTALIVTASTAWPLASPNR
jgi:hypothetical protein